VMRADVPVRATRKISLPSAAGAAGRPRLIPSGDRCRSAQRSGNGRRALIPALGDVHDVSARFEKLAEAFSGVGVVLDDQNARRRRLRRGRGGGRLFPAR
jgi:hypothetical protein